MNMYATYMDNGYMAKTSGASLSSHLCHIIQNNYYFAFTILF